MLILRNGSQITSGSVKHEAGALAGKIRKEVQKREPL